MKSSGLRPARSRALALLIAVPLTLALSSCGSGDRTLGIADPGAAPPAPTYEQVKEILDRRCVTCHGGSGGGGGGEDGDEDAEYGSCAGIVAGVGGILSTAVDGGSMPPGALPRLTEREKLIIRRWVEQGACAPCSPCP